MGGRILMPMQVAISGIPTCRLHHMYVNRMPDSSQMQNVGLVVAGLKKETKLAGGIQVNMVYPDL